MRSGIAASSSASAQNLSFKGPGSPLSKSVFSLRKSVNTAFDMAQKHVTRSMNYLQDESRHTNETCVYLNRSHTIARNCHFPIYFEYTSQYWNVAHVGHINYCDWSAEDAEFSTTKGFCKFADNKHFSARFCCQCVGVSTFTASSNR